MTEKLSDADRANQLLDRRVNEWLGNRRSPRYLLNLRELRFIQQQKPYLVWGTNRLQKERFLKASKRRYSRIAAACSLILLFLSGWGWFISQTGQPRRSRRELADLSIKQEVNSATAAIVVASHYPWQKAEYACAEKMSSPIDQTQTLASLAEQTQTFAFFVDQTQTLASLAEVAIKLEQSEKAAQLLEQALSNVENTPDDSSGAEYYKAEALRSIAEAIGKLGNAEKAAPLLERALAIGKLGNAEKAAPLLERALNSVENLQGDLPKADVLEAIAGAYIEISKETNNPQLLQQALDIAEKRSGSGRNKLLKAVAQRYATEKNWDKACQALSLCHSNFCRVEVLAGILAVKTEQEHPTLKEKEEEKSPQASTGLRA